ncbi:hypothetical protein EV702DRAFT_631709 [Suillus placidus]|uniref:C2H2-type domain-containing protein n=1 Tax=Suillus placidus TaxID=48579 RepID=A0A9P6ZM69_9AGAM|nr:hypothetical protein EV702DRAFT_631709 [Suillus placidus]
MYLSSTGYSSPHLHSLRSGYNCIWPGCDFATLIKTSYDVHFAKHTGEQRYICPHDDCDYKTHDPALFTRHRKRYHGYVPLARGRGAPSATGSGKTKSSSQLPAQPHPPPQLQPPGTFYQYRLQPMQPQPMQPQLMPPRPMPPRPMQSHPTQYQPQPTQYQPPPPIYNQSLGVFYGPADTADDYTMYTGPAMAPNGWTEGCICPELLQKCGPPL